MVEEKKRIVTATSKALVYLAVLGWIVVAILLLSGFRKINFYLLFALALLVVASFYLYLKRKRKSFGLLGIVSDISTKWHLQEKEFLNTYGFQGVPLTSQLLLVYFPKEGKTFYYDVAKKDITGVETNHPYPMLKRNEKSRLFDALAKTSLAEKKVEAAASALNIDIEDLL